MKVQNVELKHFRNHSETSFQCAGGINVFLGENGEGKTNILEGLSYLCLTKSFFGSGDSVVLQIGQSLFEVYGNLQSEAGISYHVRASYALEEGKKSFSINTSPVERFSTVIGQFPVVILSPEGNAITFGMPADRRKFIDFVISQSSKVYLEDLLEYRRILKQRNKILLDAKITRTDASDLLEPWNAELVDRGTRIIQKRRAFVQEFIPFIVEAHHLIAGNVETPSLEYIPSVRIDQTANEEETRSAFREQLRAKEGEERKIASSLLGPHRDELDFKINGMALRKYASQGQHKTFLIALKVAEFHFLRARCNETPILLLDDIFSELDAHRSERMLDLMSSLGQTFITTTNDGMFPKDFDWSGTNKRFQVHQGSLRYDEANSLIH